MLYVLTYDITSITGQNGYVSKSRQEVIQLAVSMAEIALDHLDDAVNFVEWTDLSGTEADPRKLLRSVDSDEVVNVLEQISEKLMLEDKGHINLHEHHDLFELMEAHDLASWCTPELVIQIKEVRKGYLSAIDVLNGEWESM